MKTRHLNHSSRAARLLMQLGDSLEDVTFIYSHSRLVMKVGIEDARKIIWRSEQKQLRERMRDLQQKKFIKIQKIAKQYTAILTKKGLEEYLRLQIEASELLPNNTVTMVVFDVPEKQSHVRKNLRRFLENAGFIPIQKSVWISPFDSSKKLARLFSVNKQKPWVRVFKAEEQR